MPATNKVRKKICNQGRMCGIIVETKKTIPSKNGTTNLQSWGLAWMCPTPSLQDWRMSSHSTYCYDDNSK